MQAIVRGEGLTPKPRRKRGDARSALRADSASLQFGDAAAVVAAILSGAHIVRVHDVEQIVPAVRIADAVLQAGGAVRN